MRKILSTVVAALALVSFAHVSLAGSTSVYSTQHPAPVTATKAQAWPTDITIKNRSSSFIWVTVPNSPVYDQVLPGYDDHIYSDSTKPTYVVLKDRYGRIFFADYLAPHAVKVVYDGLKGEVVVR